MGNVRLSYKKNGSSLQILEEDNYYPFGLKHKGYNKNTFSSSLGQKIKYNGKELQDELQLNVYDYGARFYEPATGRWYSVDQMAEEYYHISPYAYVDNNPIIYVDPDGNQIGMCCGDWLKGALTTGIDNVFGTNLRNKYDTGSKDFKNGKSTANGASIAVGAILEVGGVMAMKAGGTGLAGSGLLASTGVGAPVAAGTATASAEILAVGIGATALGANILSNTASNMSDDANSSSNSSGSSNKKGTGRGSNNRTADPDAVGDHTVVNENGSTTYKTNPNNPKKNNNGVGFETQKRVDYKGAAHVDKKTLVRTPTPHVQENGTVRPAIPGRDMPRYKD